MKKVILITGASSGIGKATIKQLISDGHIVYGAVRKEGQAQDIQAIGGIPIHLEMTDEQTMSAAVGKIMSEQGRIDVLFNNAGYGLYGSVEEIDIKDARLQFEVNLFGLARLTQLVIPHMRRQQSGKIINTSSMGGKIYMPLGAWYHATKHALEGWSDCLRLEMRQFGIHVVLIEPGIIETGFGDVMTEPLLRVSGNGPYEKLAHSMARSTTRAYQKGASSSPSIVAKTVSKAIRSNKPKPRYVVGKLAKPLMYMRKYLGDRIYDRVILSQFK